MLFTHLSLTTYIELAIGFLLWWFAVYLLTQNPLDRITQLSFVIFASFGFYFASDVFFLTAFSLKQYGVLEILLKSSTWSIYLPYVCLFHISYLLLKKKGLPQTVLLYLSYLLLPVVLYFEIGTNLIRNYPKLLSPQFDGDISSISGRFFWIMGVFLMFYVLVTLINFLTELVKNKTYSTEWWKYFWPSSAMVINLIFGPLILLSYYEVIPHSIFLPVINFSLTAIFFAIAVIKYHLYLEEPKVVFGKHLYYSAFATVITVSLIFKILTFHPLEISSVGDLIAPITLIFFVTAVLPLYSWLSTFINDLLYNPSSGLSVVSDNEVWDALKNYHVQSRLETSPLLRLKIVNKLARSQSTTPVDALRKVLREAVEYFKSEDESRRTKQNLKHQLLKMSVFDQAEEGQILWELGFEDYPVRIMSNETKDRPPLFRTKSPADYSYISRNAFIALKKEAIHDVTWRISYLEKLAKRK